MEIVSGRTGKAHVTSQQFRQFIGGVVGQGSCILDSGENLEPELSSNNLLKIRSGMMAHHGNISSVKLGTYDEVTLTNGSQGMKRVDLVVNRYTRNAKTEVETNEWIVIVGTPDTDNPSIPEYTVGNLQKGDLVDDCPVFAIHYDGINVVKVEKLLEIIQTNKGLSNKLSEITSIDATVKTYTDNGWTLSYRQIAAKMYYVEAYANVRGSSGTTPGNLVMAGIPIELKKEATLPVIVRVGSVPVGYGYARLSPNRGLYLSATAYGNDHDYYAYGIVSTE